MPNYFTGLEVFDKKNFQFSPYIKMALPPVGHIFQQILMISTILVGHPRTICAKSF